MNEHEDPETEFNHIDNRKNLLSGAEPVWPDLSYGDSG